MSGNIRRNSRKRVRGIKFKMIASISLIGAILLISCIISLFEYTRMNEYVSSVVGKVGERDTTVVRDTLAVSDSLLVVTEHITVATAYDRTADQVREDFRETFYRSIMPGIVATGVGILLVAMLLFFVLSYYVNPICRMNDELRCYKSFGKRYTYTCDSDDQLSELCDNVSEIASENAQLRSRISKLRDERQGDK